MIDAIVELDMDRLTNPDLFDRSNIVTILLGCPTVDCLPVYVQAEALEKGIQKGNRYRIRIEKVE